jgi:enoyl-[acyl-carrier-protein] reductase (NADH)
VRALHPLGRPGRPREAADAVRYLLSDEASFINGTVLAVDGGRSALGLDPEQAPDNPLTQVTQPRDQPSNGT